MRSGAVLLTHQPSLVEQAYEALLGEIADGTLASNMHLVQELLAERYGVSRQPIQQALLLLKTDGLVQDAGRRGLVVAPLDMQTMRDRHEARAALDALAAFLAASRCAASPEVAARTRREGEVILAAGLSAVSGGVIKADRVSSIDRGWADGLRRSHEERARKLKQSMRTAPPGSDGRMHLNRLLAALQEAVGPDAVVTTAGGDFLSFARIGLSAPDMLDPGPFGCIGIAASLAVPDRPVVVATGDGAFGFNAIEVDAAFGHFGPDERQFLFRLPQARLPVAEIASQLGRHRLAISRELARNCFRDPDATRDHPSARHVRLLPGHGADQALARRRRLAKMAPT